MTARRQQKPQQRDPDMLTPRSIYIHRRSCELMSNDGRAYDADWHEATRRAAEEWEQMQREEAA